MSAHTKDLHSQLYAAAARNTRRQRNARHRHFSPQARKIARELEKLLKERAALDKAVKAYADLTARIDALASQLAHIEHN